MTDAQRTLAGVALLVVGAVLVWLSYGPLHNLWADYRDSPNSTYLLSGIPFLVAAAAAWWGALRLLRGSRPS